MQTLLETAYHVSEHRSTSASAHAFGNSKPRIGVFADLFGTDFWKDSQQLTGEWREPAGLAAHQPPHTWRHRISETCEKQSAGAGGPFASADDYFFAACFFGIGSSSIFRCFFSFSISALAASSSSWISTQQSAIFPGPSDFLQHSCTMLQCAAAFA